MEEALKGVRRIFPDLNEKGKRKCNFVKEKKKIEGAD